MDFVSFPYLLKLARAITFIGVYYMTNAERDIYALKGRKFAKENPEIRCLTEMDAYRRCARSGDHLLISDPVDATAFNIFAEAFYRQRVEDSFNETPRTDGEMLADSLGFRG